MLSKDEVVSYYGSQSKVAEKLNIDQGAVSQWGKHVPELRAYQLERITNGELKAGDYSKERKND